MTIAIDKFALRHTFTWLQQSFENEKLIWTEK